MSLKIGGYLFTGPFAAETTEIRANQAPVVFAIIAKGGPSFAPTFRVVDIGVSPEGGGLRFADHQNASHWAAGPGERVGVYLFQPPRSEYDAARRDRLAEDLRRQYAPPRGMV